MPWIHGFVAAVPTANKAAYVAHAREAAAMFREFGAERLVECWGEDVPDGETTSMPMAVQCREDETVVFSWAWWPDRATAEAGMARMMDDPRMNTAEMPFDASRLIWGGFEVVVNE